MPSSYTKKELRMAILSKRKALTAQEVDAHSNRIFQSVIASAHYLNAKRLLIYLDFKNEVRTDAIIAHALAMGKEVYVPVVMPEHPDLALVAYTGPNTPMVLSSFGINEPIITEQNTVDFGTIDFVIAPGVAFDRDGYRLGYGGGYYDRLLAHKKAPNIPVYALAFSMQVVKCVPHDAWDKRISGFFTEEARFDVIGATLQ